MKKIKALLLCLALGLTVAATATAVACDKTPSGNTSSSDWFGDEEESVVTVRFSAPQVDVKQYESVALECTVKGSSAAVAYTSSDESIATVDENGNVTAKGVLGVATITATVEGVSASCKVNVIKAPYAPQIILQNDEYTIEKGETIAFSVETEWNKAPITEDVEYKVSLTEDSKNAKSSVSIEGNTVTVVGSDAETFSFIVSTTVRGHYTSEVVTVNVVGAKLKLQPKSLAFQPVTNGYKATISTTNLVGDMANTLPLEFVAVKGGEEVSATIDWDVEGDQIVLQDDTIIGQKRGVATLMGTVTHDGETATVQVVCDVVPPEVHLEETAVLEVENLKNLKLNSSLIGNLENVELHGAQIGTTVPGTPFIIFNKAAFPKQSPLLGRQEMIVNTDLVRYTMDVDVYTMIINDAAELDKMRSVALMDQTEWSVRFGKEVNSQIYDGYFILGNDISYNGMIMSMTDTGTVWGVQGLESEDRGFRGVFDGKGYNIDGVTVGKHPSGDVKQAGGIFGYVATGGIVKNVSFTNAVVQANTGFICSRGSGTIENVSISYKKIGGDKATNGLNSSSTPNAMGSFFTKGAGNSARVVNCLVDASAAEITFEVGSYAGKPTYAVRLVGLATNVENVIALCPDTRVLSVSGADIQRANYLDLVAEQGLVAPFDKTYWTTVEGVPMFKNQAEKIDVNAPVEFLYKEDNTLVAGFEMLILTNNPYSKIELDTKATYPDGAETTSEGVTYESNVLSATDEAFRKTVTFTATSLFNPAITATHTVYIDSFGSVAASPITEEKLSVYMSDKVLTIGDGSWMGTENYVYLGDQIIGSGATELAIDYIPCEWGDNEVTVVSVKDGAREHFTLTLHVWYKKGDFKNSTKVQENAFSTWYGSDSTYFFEEIAADKIPAEIGKAEGFENVTGWSCPAVWISAMGSEFFNNMDLSGYSDVWFAIKSVNITRYIFQTVEVYSPDWLYFHYTQTSDGVWAAEVTVNDKAYKTEFNIQGAGKNSVAKLLYRDGWANGFLIYNNNREEGAVSEENPTVVYTSEIRAISK